LHAHLIKHLVEQMPFEQMYKCIDKEHRTTQGAALILS